MAGTTEGGFKAAATNKQRYGDNFYKTIGRMGGKLSTGGGFSSMSRERLSEIGRIGGTNSRKSGYSEDSIKAMNLARRKVKDSAVKSTDKFNVKVVKEGSDEIKTEVVQTKKKKWGIL